MENNINQKTLIVWKTIKNICHKIVKSDKSLSTRDKVRISFLAILSGIIASSIFIGILGNNPINVFIDLFKGAFASKQQINNLLRLTGCFIVAALAVAFAFKTGLFNIGVSGQMLIGGGIAMVMALKFQLPWVLLIIIAMIIGSLAAGISGVLKALFNVHEVVSTLLLNWVWFFAIKYLTNTSFPYIDASGNSNSLQGASFVSESSDRTWIIIIFALLSVCVIAFVLIKTTFGFSLKTVGQNRHAAKYAGINVTKKIIFSMIISGALAGLLGSLTYLIKDQYIQYPKNSILPNEGFDGIAITLLAFNSPLGIILIALFWAILNVGSQYMSVVNGISAQVVQMIIGIIIYFAAISVLFMRLKPIALLQNFYYDLQDKNIKIERKKYYKSKQVNTHLFNEAFNNQKFNIPSKVKLQLRKNEYKKQLLQIKNRYKSKYSKIQVSDIYNKEKTNKKILISLEESKEYLNAKNEFNDWKNKYHYNDIKNIKNEKRTSQIILKKEYKFRVAKIKEARNSKNIIGIYEKYRIDVMDLITSHEILLSGLKIDIANYNRKIRKFQKNNLTKLSKEKTKYNNDNFVEETKEHILECKKNIEKQNNKYYIQIKQLKDDYLKNKKNSQQLKGAK